MINGKSFLAIIPARGGSKGVQQKNIRLVAGKPLIAWTIEAAKKSKYLDRIILSSEDEEIIKVARHWNCEVPFIRPAELAQDNVTGIEPVLHALNNINEQYDYLVLLQPTSPLRIADDIDGCIEKCILQNETACVSVTTPDKSPFWMYSLDSAGKLKPIIKQRKTVLLRQQFEGAYALNGAVYVANTRWFVKNKKFISDETVAYIMPKKRSLDIDTEFDLEICEILLMKSKELNKLEHDL
ncbi:MAG: acylneuraminate cytidylyltransferase [Deltaproteobacteria bacterium HGW-Deltaproteobacteria-12]|jgi:N-acylneuraminate cytidylyltransferase|nr:MAG: acylneuraminate cytidylyltransferase [Deltaproteobacteria bacterium HGW-Deltaproteobacteria-12]